MKDRHHRRSHRARHPRSPRRADHTTHRSAGPWPTAMGPARCRGGWLRSPCPAGTAVRVRSTHRLVTPTVHRPPRTTPGRRVPAVAKRRSPLADARHIPPNAGHPWPAANPDHPRFPSVRASQDVLRCSGRRGVALDLLSVGHLHGQSYRNFGWITVFIRKINMCPAPMSGGLPRSRVATRWPHCVTWARRAPSWNRWRRCEAQGRSRQYGADEHRADVRPEYRRQIDRGRRRFERRQPQRGLCCRGVSYRLRRERPSPARPAASSNRVAGSGTPCGTAVRPAASPARSEAPPRRKLSAPVVVLTV